MTSDKPRYVFDTNVIVSALLFENSTPGRAFYAALDQGDILVSLPLLIELNEVLNRPKFDRYLTREARERFLAAFVRVAILIESIETIQVCRDPKDDKVLELAIAGSATHIISGDEDLLVLSPFRTIEILSPHAFLSLIGG